MVPLLSSTYNSVRLVERYKVTESTQLTEISGPRWVKSGRLAVLPMWWHGPSFLIDSPDEWPPRISLEVVTQKQTQLEPKLTIAGEVNNRPQPTTTFIEDCSRFPILQRAFAHVLRGIPRGRREIAFSIKTDDLTRATHKIDILQGCEA